MPRFYITYTDHRGEQHQLTGAWEAATPEEAIDMMQLESGDDAAYGGAWEAHEVLSDADVIK